MLVRKPLKIPFIWCIVQQWRFDMKWDICHFVTKNVGHMLVHIWTRTEQWSSSAFIVSERSLLVINHGLRDRLPYRCGVVRHVRLSCSWSCSAVDVEHATSDHFLQPKGKLNAHHVVLFLFLPSLGVKSSTPMPFFHVSLSLVRHLPQTMVRVARIPMRLPQQP